MATVTFAEKDHALHRQVLAAIGFWLHGRSECMRCSRRRSTTHAWKFKRRRRPWRTVAVSKTRRTLSARACGYEGSLVSAMVHARMRAQALTQVVGMKSREASQLKSDAEAKRRARDSVRWRGQNAALLRCHRGEQVNESTSREDELEQQKLSALQVRSTVALAVSPDVGVQEQVAAVAAAAKRFHSACEANPRERARKAREAMEVHKSIVSAPCSCAACVASEREQVDKCEKERRDVAKELSDCRSLVAVRITHAICALELLMFCR